MQYCLIESFESVAPVPDALDACSALLRRHRDRALSFAGTWQFLIPIGVREVNPSTLVIPITKTPPLLGMLFSKHIVLSMHIPNLVTCLCKPKNLPQWESDSGSQIFPRETFHLSEFSNFSFAVFCQFSNT